MTLTEEQRAALKRVVAYMDEMYAIASPYYGCTEDANILRAMIDSSGTVEPVGGFDLEKARAADEVLPYPLDAKKIWVSGKGQMHINLPNAPSIFFTLSDLCEFRNIFHGQAAEIERLRAEISEQKGMIWKTQQVKKEQYAQIKELKADLEQSERVIEARLDVIDQQAARIKELEANCIYDPETGKVFVPDGHPDLEKLRVRNRYLEDALVEEGARRRHTTERGSSCKYYKECEQEYGNFCDFGGCPHKIDYFMKNARQHLRADGKIGPDAKPHCWQITEERKDVLRFCLSGEFNRCGCAECDRAVAVLRAMLEEAGQE